MNRLFGKLHISSLLQSNAILSRGFASTKLPKPTPNAYALFTKLNMQKGVSGRVQFPVIAEAWKTYPDEEKMKFKDEAAKRKQDAIDAFTKLPKEEQQAEFDEVAKKRADLEKKRRRRAFLKFCKETNRPTRPINAFMLYRHEKYPVKTKEDMVTGSIKAAEDWKKMSEDEKKPYVDKYNELSEIYKVAYEKWYKVHGKEYEALKKGQK